MLEDETYIKQFTIFNHHIMNDEQTDWFIEKIKEGPILPKDVPREEYDRVMSYLITTGFFLELIKFFKDEQ